MPIKRFLLVTGLCASVCFCSAQPTAASPRARNFMYRLQIGSVTNTRSFTAVNDKLRSVFESKIRFNDRTNEIIIHSDSDISRERLIKELKQAGYELKRFEQVAIPVKVTADIICYFS